MKKLDCEALYRDGRHYDNQHKNFKDDIPFYLKRAKYYGNPVLEIACGTGRITIPLAEEGIDITGLDISEGMLEAARKKAEEKHLPVNFFKADCRYFNMKRKFNLIFIPFNSFVHIHDLESIENCFKHIREHLAEDGRFILDIFNPKLEYLTMDPDEKTKAFEYPDPKSNGNVIIHETMKYDKATQVNYIKWYYKIGDGPEKVEELNMRIFYPQEIDALLKYNGFEIENKFGDFDESEFTSESPKQIIICKQRKK